LPVETLFIAGLAYAAIQVVGVGLALLILLRRFGLIVPGRPETYVVASIALGVLWGALFVTTAYLLGSRFDIAFVTTKIIADATIIAVAAFVAWPQSREIATALVRQPALLLLISLGYLLGTWAYLQFPHVADSGQIMWTQAAMQGQANNLSAMLGYTGIVVVVARLFDHLPVITSAAAFKPLLGALAGAIAYHAASAAGLRFRALNATSLLLLMCLSKFGLHGMFELGKDSIFGILFGMAFLTALCRPAAEQSGLELGLYFAAAATTGVIAVPYMLAAYLIWIVISDEPRSAVQTVPVMLAVNAAFLPVALAGFTTGSNPAPLFLAYMAFSGIVLLAIHFAPALPGLGLVRRFRAWLPMLCAAPAALLMPAAVEMISWYRPDGSPVVELRPPLDGKTTFLAYFLAEPIQIYTVTAGGIAAMFLGFSPLGRRRPGLVALCAMPFAVLLLLLVRAHSGLPILSGFNVWDLTKDIPQWLGGPLFGFVAIVGLNVIADVLKRPRIAVAALSLALALVINHAARTVVRLEHYARPLHYTSTGAWAERDLAIATDLTWREFRGHDVILDETLDLTKNYFYYFQMYDARPVALQMDQLGFFTNRSRIGMAVSNVRLGSIKKWALAQRASLRYLAPLQEGQASLLAISFDGRSEVSVPPGISHAEFVSGVYATENQPSGTFRWVRAISEIEVATAEADHVCVEVSLFSAKPGLNDEQHIRLEARDGWSKEVNLAGSSPSSPTTIRMNVDTKDGASALRILAQFSEVRFPGDTRRIAFGALLPIRLTAGQTCS
jgi:hypothetical protein